MINFYENLIDLALKLMDQKSTKDDIKAALDIEDIDNMLNLAQNTKTYIDDAKELDAKIVREYPIIEDMCAAASVMSNLLLINQNKKYKTELEIVMNNLLADKFGIMASVLLKHEQIKSVKEFIKGVD